MVSLLHAVLVPLHHLLGLIAAVSDHLSLRHNLTHDALVAAPAFGFGRLRWAAGGLIAPTEVPALSANTAPETRPMASTESLIASVPLAEVAAVEVAADLDAESLLAPLHIVTDLDSFEIESLTAADDDFEVADMAALVAAHDFTRSFREQIIGEPALAHVG